MPNLFQTFSVSKVSFLSALTKLTDRVVSENFLVRIIKNIKKENLIKKKWKSTWNCMLYASKL